MPTCCCGSNGQFNIRIGLIDVLSITEYCPAPANIVRTIRDELQDLWIGIGRRTLGAPVRPGTCKLSPPLRQSLPTHPRQTLRSRDEAPAAMYNSPQHPIDGFAIPIPSQATATNCEPLANVKFGRIGMPSCYLPKSIAKASAMAMTDNDNNDDN